MQVKILDTSFLFNQIRAYNKATKPKLKDKILSAVGVYAGLMKTAPLGQLTPEERDDIHNFLSDFCQYQGLKVQISGSRMCFIKAQQEELVETKL